MLNNFLVANKLKKTLLLTTVLAVAVFVSLISTSKAQQLDSLSISVSPQSLDIAINPGESAVNVFRITNASEQAITIRPTPKNFLPSGNEGAIALLEEEDETPFSLSNWMTVSPSSDTVIQPRQTQDFTLTIDVPDNADPGGHFGSVVFSTVPDEQEGAVALISQEVAPVILVKIPGEVSESAEISSFRSLKSFVTTQTSNEIELIVKNNGNVHFRPTGNVVIKNSWGKEVATLSVDGRNVIPLAERKMNVIWENFGFRFGRYSAEATLVYGSNNQIITAQTNFYVFPYHILIPILLILVFVVFVIYKGKRRIARAFKALTSNQQDN